MRRYPPFFCCSWSARSLFRLTLCSLPAIGCRPWRLLPALRLVPVSFSARGRSARGFCSPRHRLPLLGACARRCGSCRILSSSPVVFAVSVAAVISSGLRFAAPWRLFLALRLASLSLPLSLPQCLVVLSSSAMSSTCSRLPLPGAFQALRLAPIPPFWSCSQLVTATALFSSRYGLPLLGVCSRRCGSCRFNSRVRPLSSRLLLPTPSAASPCLLLSCCLRGFCCCRDLLQPSVCRSLAPPGAASCFPLSLPPSLPLSPSLSLSLSQCLVVFFFRYVLHMPLPGVFLALRLAPVFRLLLLVLVLFPQFSTAPAVFSSAPLLAAAPSRLLPVLRLLLLVSQSRMRLLSSGLLLLPLWLLLLLLLLLLLGACLIPACGLLQMVFPFPPHTWWVKLSGSLCPTNHT